MKKYLQNSECYCIIAFVIAVMAQSVERRLGKAEVTGSIPVNSLIRKRSREIDFSFFSIMISNAILVTEAQE